MSDSVKQNTFKDAVCVEAMRVFDSCSSQDCLEDLLVSVDAPTQELLNNASHVKIPCAEVIDATFTVDAVPFNKGFYSVDITYTFSLDLQITPCGDGAVTDATGSCKFSKKVILFGSEGNTKAFEIVRDTMGEKLDAEEIEERDHSIVVLPAKDIASSFCDANRSIDDRQYREYYFEGGRGSTKSSFISEKIIELLENNPRMCAVIMRKVKDTLKDSVFAQLEWAIDTIGETYPHIKADYKLTKSPLEITKLSTGQKIYFRRSR